jgi:pantoate--beta-alanine ligase
MKVIHQITQMQQFARELRERGKKIALVPTMGCLHEGHLSLLRKGKKIADELVVTIFVNPLQFGPNEDFGAYPRQFEKDCGLVAAEGAIAVFSPTDEEMYPTNFQSKITVTRLSQGMCGADRPGHFDGVATVVAKLFNIVSPDFAIFGEKDFQQLALLRQMSKDLNFNLQIIGCPIVREDDGLAMSSRNKYLQGQDRIVARCLSQAIKSARELVQASVAPLKTKEIQEHCKMIIEKAGASLEYCVIIDERDLAPQDIANDHSVLAIAAKIGGKVRLIDNGKLIIA